MDQFSLTHSINDKIFKFGMFYGRISALKQNSQWVSKLANVSAVRSGIAALSVDKDIFEKVDLSAMEKSLDADFMVNGLLVSGYKSYIAAKNYLMQEGNNLSFNLELFNNIHGLILKESGSKSQFRKKKRLLPKHITEHGVVKNVTLEVVTSPTQIPQKLQSFLKWFHDHSLNYNPVLLAAITHFRIAEIHPYDDGNGRLCRLLDYLILGKGNIDIYQIAWLEYYFLLHSERYYNLIETTIASQDLAEWIEFYTDALLNSIFETAKVVYKFTGGAVDIKNNIVHELSELEMKVIELMQYSEHSSPFQMSRELGYSKQNICRILKNLHEKGIIKKTGQNTGVRYAFHK